MFNGMLRTLHARIQCTIQVHRYVCTVMNKYVPSLKRQLSADKNRTYIRLQEINTEICVYCIFCIVIN